MAAGIQRTYLCQSSEIEVLPKLLYTGTSAFRPKAKAEYACERVQCNLKSHPSKSMFTIVWAVNTQRLLSCSLECITRLQARNTGNVNSNNFWELWRLTGLIYIYLWINKCMIMKPVDSNSKNDALNIRLDSMQTQVSFLAAGQSPRTRSHNGVFSAHSIFSQEYAQQWVVGRPSWNVEYTTQDVHKTNALDGIR